MKALLFIILCVMASLAQAQSSIKPLIHSLSHTGSINDISGNGEKILTCSDDKRAMLWNYKKELLGEFLFPISNGTDGILYTCDLTNDANYAVTGGETGHNSFYYFYVLNCNNFKTVDKIAGFSSPIKILRYSPDNKYLAGVDKKGIIKIYSTEDYSEYTTINELKNKSIINIEYLSNHELFIATNTCTYHIDYTSKKKKANPLVKKNNIVGASQFCNNDTTSLVIVNRNVMYIYKKIGHGKFKETYKEKIAISEELAGRCVIHAPDNKLILNNGRRISIHNPPLKSCSTFKMPTYGHVSEKNDSQPHLRQSSRGTAGYLQLKASNNISTMRLDRNTNPLFAIGDGGMGWIVNDSLHYIESNSISIPFSPQSMKIEDTGWVLRLYDIQNKCHTLDFMSLLEGKDSFYSSEPYSSTHHYEYIKGRKKSTDNSIYLKIIKTYSNYLPISFGGYYLAIGKKKKETFTMPDIISDVEPLNYRDILVVAFQNGMIKWFKFKGSQLTELLSFYTNTNNWIFWTPEGDYYCNNSKADELLLWVNNKFIDQENQNWYIHYSYSKVRKRFMEVFNACDDDGKVHGSIYLGTMHVTSYEDELEFRRSSIPREILPVTNLNITSIANQEVQKDCDTINVQNEKIVLNYKVDETNMPFRAAYDIPVRLDGMPYQTENTYNQINFRLPQRKSYNLTLSLNNKDKAETSNQDRQIYLKWTGAKEQEVKSTLRVIALGVNQYNMPLKSQAYDLDFCVQDAEKIAEKLSTQKGYFKCEDPVILTNNNATKNGLVARLNELSAISDSSDVSVMFMSGHGYLTGDSLFHFITSNVKSESDIPYSSFTTRQIQNFMQKYKGKLVLMIDACYSGAALQELQQSLPKDCLQRIAIFTSSRKSEKSFENMKTNHSNFITDILSAFSFYQKEKFIGRITVGDLYRLLMKMNNSHYSNETLHCPENLMNQILYFDEKNNQ